MQGGCISNEEQKIACSTDGLPYEFYKRFWSLAGPDLVAVFNSSYHSGLLPLSQRSALISLLFKKG